MPSRLWCDFFGVRNRMLVARWFYKHSCLLFSIAGYRLQKLARYQYNIGLRYLSSSTSWNAARVAYSPNLREVFAPSFGSPNSAAEPEYDFEGLLKGIKQKLSTGKQFLRNGKRRHTTSTAVTTSLQTIVQLCSNSSGRKTAINHRFQRKDDSCNAVRENTGLH